ncbi:MAG: UDP-N-acetylglucosamine pyrophosphorylase [Ruminococcaceae bacterium]|nr:UDP-N-acetylglucosamine pyrophosphorylase [Oscillospiraceae bacterium]
MIQTEALFDLSYTVLGDFLRNYTYPWEALSHIGQAILAWGEMLDKERYDQPKPGVWIAKTATVAHSACLVAPCIIDEGAEVRHCAFLRGNVLVGKRAVVGNSTELKNAILFDQAQVPHFNYVGDSILGYKAHFGAGTVTSNVKCDKSPIVLHFSNGAVQTGLFKMGAMVGDHCEVGCNSVLNPGTILGRGVTVYPLSSVRGTVADGMIYKSAIRVCPRR